MTTSCSKAVPSRVTEPNRVRSILGFMVHLATLVARISSTPPVGADRASLRAKLTSVNPTTSERRGRPSPASTGNQRYPVTTREGRGGDQAALARRPDGAGRRPRRPPLADCCGAAEPPSARAHLVLACASAAAQTGSQQARISLGCAMLRYDGQLPGLLPMLSGGKHGSPRKGACFMEFASLLAGERWSDHPGCTHPLLAAVARHVNDHTSDAGRPRLAGLIPSVI